MKGFIFAVFAAIIWGITPIIEKVGLSSKTMNPVAGVVFRSIGSFIASLVLFFFLIKLKPGIFKNVNLTSISFLMAGGILASVIGQMFFYTALKNGNASVVTPVAGSFPLITFILGVLLLNEGISVSKVLGVILVVSGVILLK